MAGMQGIWHCGTGNGSKQLLWWHMQRGQHGRQSGCADTTEGLAEWHGSVQATQPSVQPAPGAASSSSGKQGVLTSSGGAGAQAATAAVRVLPVTS